MISNKHVTAQKAWLMFQSIIETAVEFGVKANYYTMLLAIWCQLQEAQLAEVLLDESVVVLVDVVLGY